MFENDNENGFFAGMGDGDGLDLGSNTGGDFADFTFLDDKNIGDIFGDEKEDKAAAPDTPEPDTSDIFSVKKTENEAEEAKNEKKVSEPKAASNEAEKSDTDKPAAAEVPDLFEAAIAKAEKKQAESAKSSLTEKLPVFSYASVKEEIVDTSKTFDQLRKEKSEDFPELDDSSSVTWKVEYGKITKAVPTPNKTTIAGFKSQIENSKEFLDSLKKAKGEIECKVTPSVTAKKKGVISPYKGVFNSVDEAVASGKKIAFVPSEDGRVYEIRNNRIGTFIAEADRVTIVKKVRAGFIPALPKIPYSILSELIAFFKACITETSELEALAYIYWSFYDSKYYVYVPKQEVSKDSVDTFLPDMDEEKFVLAMEVHSHNTMPAVFSCIDNKDERATRIYTVIGRLDKVFPDITTRISVGGKFVELNPDAVFERIEGDFPESWKDAVCKRQPEEKGADL